MSSSPRIVIFSQPGCPTCQQVKAYLSGRGLSYEERDVSSDEAAFNELQERGYAATPLTVVGDVEILGMNRIKLNNALGQLAPAAAVGVEVAP